MIVWTLLTPLFGTARKCLNFVTRDLRSNMVKPAFGPSDPLGRRLSPVSVA